MKDQIRSIVFVVAFILIIGGIVLYNLDHENVRKGLEPKYCLKIENAKEEKISYMCLGYVMYRTINKSMDENIGDAKKLEFGPWFINKEIIIITPGE